MSASRWPLILLLAVMACSKHSDNGTPDGPALPQCSDGIDNDGDGKIDYPDDPGCLAPQQDDETDDCPDGPNCPQCGNGKDDDGNGLIDYPSDPGCTAASDPIEFTFNAEACGSTMTVKQFPTTGVDMGGSDSGILDPDTSSSMLSSTCGAMNGEGAVAYVIMLDKPMVVTATSMGTGNIVSIRSVMCTDASAELACSPTVTGTTTATVIKALNPGVYYVVVELGVVGGTGGYQLTVQTAPGAGSSCTGPTDCGPGLVCHPNPNGGGDMVCEPPYCSDGIDNDGDGKIDYPNDPGCTSPTDDDETDDCPSGPNCPACSNGIDDDNDTFTDWPADTSCHSASDASESCTDSEGVTELVAMVTQGDTTTATNDFEPACAEETGGADLTYRIDVPALTALTIDVQSDAIFPVAELLNSTCGGTAIECEEDTDIVRAAVAAGTYYIVVDDSFGDETGPFTLTVSGTIKNGASCESQLAQSGALACSPGYACKGTAGSRVCALAQCSDGIDNDGDGKTDYPFDPGCDSPSDDDESDTCPGAGCPVCSNGMDDDADGLTDFPADWGCDSAAGASEVFCTGEMDVGGLITKKQTLGTTVGTSEDITFTCEETFSGDVSYALSLPVPVASLQVDTIGSGFDTVLQVQDANCMTVDACDDESGGTDGTSKIVMTNVNAGNYAINVGAFDGDAAFKLNVKGTVANGTVCTSPLFTAGVLVCPTGKTCTAGKCQ